jgi:hypothetical protein
MKDIIDHSMSLRYAVIERDKKIYAIERMHLMKSDKVIVWTSTMLSAKSWRGAIISDLSGVDRQWSPVRIIPIKPY